VSSLKFALYLAGGVLEVAGIVLVAAPDLGPMWHAGQERLRKAWDRLGAKVRALLRRPRHVTASASLSGGVALGGSARGIVGVNPAATTDEKVAFLLRRDEETQNRIADLHEALAAASTDADRKLAEARAELEARLALEIRRALDLYRGQRLAGIGLLVLGAIFLSAGNFVS
jgi:hypothetical protein